MNGPHTGQRFGAYLLDHVVGRGGMGVVYRARHEHLDRVVALKLLTPDLADTPGFRERFLRESRVAASLDHPGVVTVYDAGEVGGTLYIAMQFVQGTDLAALLAAEGALAPARAMALLEQVASALDVAHEHGLVHRDVKPANVMLDGERCYLTDFGLTKPMDSETALTAAGQFLGTVAYVSPEQITGRPLDGRADVYALGCVLYECLTGSRPFPRPADVAILYAHLHDPPPRPSEASPGLPAGLDDVVAKAMAKAPDSRYPTCGALVAAARDALSSAPPPGATVATVAPAPRDPVHVYRHRRRYLGAALAVLAVVGVVAALLVSSGGGDSPATGDQSGSQPRVAGAAVPVGKRPFGVTVAAGSLWVANNSSGTVSRVVLDGRRRTDIRVGRGPFGISSSGDSVWVANSLEGTVSRIDARSGHADPAVDVGESPYFVAAGGGSVFVTNGGSGTVSAVGAGSAQEIRVGPQPRGIARRGDSAWVANKGDGTVSRIDADRAVLRVHVGRNPVGVALTRDAVWVANKDSDTVSRIPLGGGSAKQIKVGAGPFGIVAGAGHVWVANSGDDSVMRLDPDSGEVSARIRVPGQPVGITVGAGSIWVTVNDRNAVVRIEP